MTARSLCIHGHFYQPPREDPLIGAIPHEAGAEPYRNWNERIHAECYRPNAERGNFARISFNIGPTLFCWMESYDPATYRLIVEQDGANVRRHGVGSAIAQCYNHTIMPLATRADKETQIAWGIADFTHRFRRRPQGMWLPETAVDAETLAIMADFGIEFTILAPWQAEADALDTTEPYRVNLPGGRSIAAFFYHQGLSGRVSFDSAMTTNADTFALYDLAAQFNAEKEQRGEPQLVLVASDGELYGHHQPFRDMFLAHLLTASSAQSGVEPAFLARWLREHPPRRSIGVRERTSWSCHHGVARWMDDCGWDLIGEAAGRRLPAETTSRIHTLLEAQRERQHMFTSCGWFFEDFDRIEPKNNVAYAARAVQLTHMAAGVDLSPLAVEALRHVVSQRTGLCGDQVCAHQIERAEKRGIRQLSFAA